MTEKALRQLDGRELTAEAFRLGLAPATTQWHSTVDKYFFEDTTAQDRWTRWQPHVNLAQADAMGRRLRARGWATTIHWFPVTPYGAYPRDTASGLVNARRLLPDTWGQSFNEVFVTEREEAHALLLVSVLAASAEEAVHGS